MKLKKYYDKNGLLTPMITKEDIYEMGRENAIIGSVISSHEHGNLDWNAALALMVATLAEQNGLLMDQLASITYERVMPILRRKSLKYLRRKLGRL